MLAFNYDLPTFYDRKTKIWSGGKAPEYYDKNCSYGRILYEEMRRHPKRICQISASELTELTNEEVLLQAAKIARYFALLGIQQSDIIGLIATNTTYLMGVVLACFFHGSAFHAINPNVDKKTTQHLLHLTKPKIIFCDGEILEKIKYASSDLDAQIITMKDHVKDMKSVLDLLQPTEQNLVFEPADLENGPDQPFAILCSSGSTGLPKAVTISNRRLHENLNFLTAEDVQFVPSTMDWITGLLTFVGSIVYGTLKIICEHPFTPESFLEIVHKYKVTFTMQAPPNMAMLLNCSAITPQKLDSMRHFLFGGGRCMLQTQQLMQSYLRNARLVYMYGFTEFENIVTCNYHFDKKPGSVGRLFPGYKARIVDDNGNGLGPNAVGEILTYHDRVWNGYYNNIEATQGAQDQEGWFNSGDLGYFDEDNYFFIVDRKKDLLKYKRMQYTPSQVEDEIAKMPGVSEVCVFGVWSELDGDAAAAAVVREKGSTITAEDVVAFVQETIEAPYKHLHGGAVIWDQLPKTPSGKIDRPAIKRIFMETCQGKNLK